MSDTNDRCAVCHGLLDEEDLFCANCGTEAPEQDRQGEQTTRILRHAFDCDGCGASMSYDPEAQSLRCPFCGSENLTEQPSAPTLGPSSVIPFAVDREAAEKQLRDWLGKGFFRPGDLSERAAITKMSQVYVPYWIFTARTFTYWTADTSETPLGARGDWYPLTGEHRGVYRDLIIGASGVLTPAETMALCPFNLELAVPAVDTNLDRHTVEQFRVQRKYARPLAHQQLEQLDTAACASYIPGRQRNLKVNVRVEGMSSEPVVLPVWIMAYRYQDQVFRFLLNGQTGKATGTAPTSYKKVALLVAGILAAILVLLVCGSGLSGMLD